MRNSAEYEALLIQTYHLAAARLEELVAGREPGSWAVALDADETVLDNSQFTLEGELSGEGYDRARWEEWVRRQEAGAVPGAVGFLHRVHELGGRVAIVTNRSVADCPDTEANLRALGAPLDVILCRDQDGQKESRWRQVEEGTAAPGLPPAEIVLWVGDNIKDFPGLDQDLRFEDEEVFDRFGVEYFIVPNPTYGSWEHNPDRSEE
jgi:5'-nucleotidase (lipoprotein e(P4) family)